MTESQTPPPSPEEENKPKIGIIVIAAAIALAITLSFALLGESGPSKANGNLRGAIDQARGLYGTALALMANPAGPIKDSPQKDSEAPLDTLNPKALDAISQADTTLAKAIMENSAASDEVRAIANNLMSSILSLKGYYHLTSSVAARGDARNAIASAQREIDTIKSRIALAEYLDKLAKTNNTDIDTIYSKAVQDATSLKTAGKQISADIKELRSQESKLKADIAKLATKAGKVRAESRSAKGQKGMDLLDLALASEKQIDSLMIIADDIHDQITQKASLYRNNELKLAYAENLAKATKDIAENRKTQMSERLKESQSCRRLVDVSKGNIVKLTEKLIQICSGIREIQDLAAEAYVRADKAHEAAVKDQGDGDDARKADIALAAANLIAEKLSLQKQLELLANDIKKVWPKLSSAPAPQVVQNLTAYVKDIDKSRTQAADKYRLAVKFYSSAIKSAKKINKWVYQGQLAAVHLNLYRLSEDPQELAKAEKVIANALQDKEASDYLKPVLRLREMLKTKR